MGQVLHWGTGPFTMEVVKRGTLYVWRGKMLRRDCLQEGESTSGCREIVLVEEGGGERRMEKMHEPRSAPSSPGAGTVRLSELAVG